MLLDRFIKYCKINTKSDDYSLSTPSTLIQYDLLNLLKEELDKLGVDNELTKEGRLYGYIDGNNALDPIGLNAHVDTAPDFSGTNVNPIIIYNYDGKDIKLGNTKRVLSPNEYPFMNKFIHKTLITTDGTTLLGADDKAGVAIIMEIVENVLKLPKESRRPMYILFTPDEEIGRGAEHFDRSKFKAKFAYTFDGSEPEIINIETFNAKSADINVIGKSIHPGDAKDIMVNAALVLNEFISMLPPLQTPSHTEGYEGFNHLTEISGNTDKAFMNYILRNHDKKKLEEQVALFKEIAEILKKKYPAATIDLKIKDQYQNMIEVISKKPECKEYIEKIYKKLGLEVTYLPIRGGTDGATFSFKGCPTPNLGTGSYNHHGPYEFAVLEEMELLVKIGTEIFKN